MRELKFRQAITDKDGTFRWHYWGYLHIDTFGLPVFINPLGPVEWDKRPSYQFTGQKDKKRTEEYPEGQEIYEGDKVSSGFWGGTVEFVSGAFKIVQPGYSDSSNFDVTEIIGNVHQPKLLEQENA